MEQLEHGVVHTLPDDLMNALLSSRKTIEIWQGLTPLARNEWICWVEEARKQETRKRRIHRCLQELVEGKRRPCCWPGCPHRKKGI